MEIFRPKIRKKYSAKLEYKKEEQRSEEQCDYLVDGKVKCSNKAIFFFIQTCEHNDSPLSLCSTHEGHNFYFEPLVSMRRPRLYVDEEIREREAQRIKKGGCGCK